MEASYTIPQFCAAYHISRVHYYTLKDQGKVPQELRLGRRVIITRRAAEAWEEKLLKEQNEQPNWDAPLFVSL
ncbi:excisionase [Massilia sp. CCM 8695]|uniref:Excisionase n=1 Tax=Massilia frigida TaxID=2609281 RepID=A0ABX0NIU1_9BURK|nr:excisionase [Massilia frigida]NHZ83951.1 excisionase [Massilia frigida]